MSKTGITIKGGNTTRLGLLSRILDLTEELITHCDRGYSEEYISEQGFISTTQVYKAVAETIATINTNGQGITVTGCNFTSMDTGMKIEQSPEENLEETTQEGIIEEDEDSLEKCADCELNPYENPCCEECEFKEYRGINLKE